MLSFSKVLKQYRIENKKSQRQIIEKIKSIDHTFKNLDEITYSRWENDHTSPSIIKKCKILRMLEKYSELVFFIKNSNFGKNKYQKIINKRYCKHYQDTDSAYYTSVKEVFYKHERAISIETYQMICNFQGEIYGNAPSFEKLIKFQKICHETHSYIYRNKNGDLLGHSVFFKVHWGVIKNHLDKIKCQVRGFIPDSEIIIFIASDYAMIKDLEYFKFKIYRDYFLSSKVNYFFTRTFHQQGIKLCDSLSPVVVTTPQAQNHGVAYLSQKYPWVGFAGNIDNFLTTDISAFAEDNSKGTKFLKWEIFMEKSS